MHTHIEKAMSDYLSKEYNGTELSIIGVVLSIMVIGFVFVLITALNPVYGRYIINQEYVIILLALLVGSVVVAIVLRRAQEDIDTDETFL